MKKIIGYILAVLGVIGIATYSFPELLGNAQSPEGIGQYTGTPLLVISIVLVAIGAFVTVRSGKERQKVSEVPIFQGGSVVGYRRN